MARFTVFGSFFLAIAAAVLCCPAAADTRLALVIGNGAYPSGPLSSPEKDGQAVAAKLKGLGFAVTERLDLKRDELLGAIREFGERLAQQPDAVGLFYYSGHGMSVNSRNYIIPVDANIRSEADVELYAVPVENVLLRMTMAQDKANIIILDACRDNPFEKRWKSSSGGLAPINDEPIGTLIAYAAAPGHVAEAGLQGSLSKYTEALVTLIDQPDVNLIAMFQNIQNAVYRSTQGHQQPYLEISPGLPTYSFNVRPPRTGNTVAAVETKLALERGKKLENEGRYTEAAAAYKQAADQGNAEGQYELGHSYFNGLGLTQSYVEAGRYWAMAAAQQYPSAQEYLGLLYCQGLGVKQSSAEAKRLFELALAGHTSGHVATYYLNYLNLFCHQQ
jgi:hypothetical protein